MSTDWGGRAHKSASKALPAVPRGTLWGAVLASNTKATAPWSSNPQGIASPRIWPNKRPLPRGWARFLSLIYGIVVYKVGPAHRSLGTVSNTSISFKLNNTHRHTDTHGLFKPCCCPGVFGHVGQSLRMMVLKPPFNIRFCNSEIH